MKLTRRQLSQIIKETMHETRRVQKSNDLSSHDLSMSDLRSLLEAPATPTSTTVDGYDETPDWYIDVVKAVDTLRSNQKEIG